MRCRRMGAWGWQIEGENLVPTRMTSAPAPDELVKTISYACIKGCLTACTCRKLVSGLAQEVGSWNFIMLLKTPNPRRFDKLQLFTPKCKFQCLYHLDYKKNAYCLF